MKVISGDLIDLAKQKKFDVIVHGCNCFCAMGKGIARNIRDEFPAAYTADCRTKKGDKSKLGKCGLVYIPQYDLTVVNAYTQYDFRGPNPNIDYNAIRSCFSLLAKLLKDPKYENPRIGYPKIGAGLARGDWSTISKIIDEELDGFDHTLVEYRKPVDLL